jgi:hypothetical protein
MDVVLEAKKTAFYVPIAKVRALIALPLKVPLSTHNTPDTTGFRPCSEKY